MHTHIERESEEMTLPLSSNFPWFLLSFAITFISFFIAFSTLIYTQLLELRSRADDDFLLRNFSSSFSLHFFLLLLWFSVLSSFPSKYSEIKQNEMKINIEVDFNFPPDYGNPVLFRSYFSICMTMCLVWRFSVIVIIAQCCMWCVALSHSFSRSLIYSCIFFSSSLVSFCVCFVVVNAQIRSRSFNVYKSQML